MAAKTKKASQLSKTTRTVSKPSSATKAAPATTSAKTLRTGPKEVFLELMRLTLLYISVISVGILSFAYVDLSFPDVLNYYPFNMLSAIRVSSAMLVVSFPLFLFFSWLIQRDLRQTPAKHELKFGRWLVYLTLFITSITLIIDLIVLVNEFYSGELTLPFALKVLCIFVLAGVVFGYYFWEIRHEPQRSNMPAIVGWLSAVAVLGLLILGFLLAGSPSEQRDIRLDEQRVNSLSMVQNELINYWQTKEVLPESLEEMEYDLGWFQAPVDPERKTPYSYKVTGDLSFELCANFARPTPEWNQERKGSVYGPYGEADQNWEHSAGETCFKRTIDPERYPKPTL